MLCNMFISGLGKSVLSKAVVSSSLNWGYASQTRFKMSVTADRRVLLKKLLLGNK